MSEPPPQNLLARVNLTASSKAALREAHVWVNTSVDSAATENPESAPKRRTLPVTAPALLVGILRSHPDTENSELRQMLEHFGVPVATLERDLGLEGSPPQAPTAPPPEEMMLDPEAEAILQRAAEFADAFNASERLVRLGDLFGGVVSVPNEARSLLAERMSISGASFDEVASSYPNYLEESRDREGVTFRSFLEARFPLGSEARLGPLVAGYNADLHAGHDLVGIAAEVDAFAYLISAKTLHPPLAVGLFGDWGAGKSFFMESLRERIYEITDDARAAERPQRDIAVFKRVVQIEFNAWHYVEGDLWASLVEHIFRNLKTHPREAPSLLRKRQERYIRELEKKRRARKVVRERELHLAQQKEAKQKRIDELRESRDEKLEKLSELRARDVLSAIELEEEDENLLTALGLRGTYASARELTAALAAARAVLADAGSLTASLRYRGRGWIAGLILVILAGPLVSWLLVVLSNDTIPGLTNALASISAVMAGGAALLKDGSSWLRGKLDRIERYQRTIDEKQREKERQIERLEKEHAEHQADLDQLQAEQKEISNQIDDLERSLNELTPSRILNDFVRERVGSREYQSRLGVAALIRQDFEQLADLIREHNEEFIRTDSGTPTAEEPLFINRIVLYIDDLDRCPPERVVDVLQAVHLLMAFDLFVVVVAVDARWLSKSLQKHYEELLSADAVADQATPQDYLEKIFQIAFWVRPLEAAARGRMIRGLLDSSVKRPAADGAESARTVATAGRGEAGGSEGGDAGAEEGAPTGDGSGSAAGRTDPDPAGLEITPEELEFMTSLQTLLGKTPRSIKRFVNMFRLMKVMYLAPESSGGDRRAETERVLFLLALMAGCPELTPWLLERSVRAEPATTLNDFVSDPATRREGRFEEAARSLSEWLDRHPDWKEVRLESLAGWVPKVARFSFEHHEGTRGA